jgi:hypothetical protein
VEVLVVEEKASLDSYSREFKAGCFTAACGYSMSVTLLLVWLGAPEVEQQRLRMSVDHARAQPLHAYFCGALGHAGTCKACEQQQLEQQLEFHFSDFTLHALFCTDSRCQVARGTSTEAIEAFGLDMNRNRRASLCCVIAVEALADMVIAYLATKADTCDMYAAQFHAGEVFY